MNVVGMVVVFVAGIESPFKNKKRGAPLKLKIGRTAWSSTGIDVHTGYRFAMGPSFFYSIHFLSQPMTSSCHWMLLLGLRTQWFSSGK